MEIDQARDTLKWYVQAVELAAKQRAAVLAATRTPYDSLRLVCRDCPHDGQVVEAWRAMRLAEDCPYMLFEPVSGNIGWLQAVVVAVVLLWGAYIASAYYAEPAPQPPQEQTDGQK